MRKRAESRDETRRRIIDATMQLHEEVGPSGTTISAIAQRAGVQRLTVYRHFPDEMAVFSACTAHWLERNPPPNPEGWRTVADPWDRLQRALNAFYDYYAATQRMWTASHRDVGVVRALQGPMAEFASYVDRIADDLVKALRPERGQARSVSVTTRHALAFPTWTDLQARGLTDPQKAELAVSWLRGMAPGRGLDTR